MDMSHGWADYQKRLNRVTVHIHDPLAEEFDQNRLGAAFAGVALTQRGRAVTGNVEQRICRIRLPQRTAIQACCTWASV